MENRNPRLVSSITAALAVLFFTLPALALDFKVHGYDLGERIELTNGRKVYTAEFDVSLDGVADHLASFCVDLDTYLGVGEFSVRDVLDAYNDPSPADEAARDFAWAGHVMDRYGFDVDQLVTTDVSRDQAITGVQAAIWEGLYGLDRVEADSLSNGARAIFDRIMADYTNLMNPDGSWAFGDGPALVVEMVGKQDQVISAPVPEPGAALVFGLGSVIAGSAARRRERR